MAEALGRGLSIDVRKIILIIIILIIIIIIKESRIQMRRNDVITDEIAISFLFPIPFFLEALSLGCSWAT